VLFLRLPQITFFSDLGQLPIPSFFLTDGFCRKARDLKKKQRVYLHTQSGPEKNREYARKMLIFLAE